MQHSSNALTSRLPLTNGKPALLEEHPASISLAQSVARLQGLEAGLLYPSTLHLFWDLFQSLGRRPVAVFIDREAYPIAGWGAKWLNGQRIPVMTFSHGDHRGLKGRIKASGRMPVIITDGWCTHCESVMPIRQYLEILSPHKGLLVMDDTQALGILGQGPTPDLPYGRGGGGTLRWLGLQAENVIIGSSLAKGFGTPLAVLAGSHPRIAKVKKDSLTRQHCSPPDHASVMAGHRALLINQKYGHRCRERLLSNVQFFRSKLGPYGILDSNTTFPLQKLGGMPGPLAQQLQLELDKAGIRIFLVAGAREQVHPAFLIRADHRFEDLAHACRITSRHLNCLNHY